jgi:hypothetical protein
VAEQRDRLTHRQEIQLREHWHEVWTSEPFGFVLALVFALFVFMEAAPDREWAAVFVVLLQGATLLASLRAARPDHPLLRACAVIVALAVLTSSVAVMGAGEEISRPFVRIVSMLLIAVAPIEISRSVLRSVIAKRRVTLQSIFGVVSVYLLLGMLFAYGYAAIGELGHVPFFGQVSKDATTIQDYLYFSFVALTTTGFGDLTAAHQLGRALSNVESLVGQLYLIIVLSLFVGNLRPQRQPQG